MKFREAEQLYDKAKNDMYFLIDTADNCPRQFNFPGADSFFVDALIAVKQWLNAYIDLARASGRVDKEEVLSLCAELDRTDKEYRIEYNE